MIQIEKSEIITKSGLHVSMPVPGVVRVTDGNHRDSYMVSAKMRKRAPRTRGSIAWWGKISIAPEEGLALYYQGKLLCRDYTGPRSPVQTVSPEEQALLAAEGHLPQEALEDRNALWPVEVCKELPANAAIYGLGDKTGYLNKRHYAYENWNTDDPAPHCDNFRSLYKSINFFIISTPEGCCGILADNTCRTRFDFGKENDSYLYWSHAGGSLDYYMIPGKDLKEVLRGYLRLTGAPQLQQKWVYGFHQSHWSYFSAGEVCRVVDTMRENRLPMDSIHMDIDYMDGYRVFTFQPDRFPDPKGLSVYLAARNVKPIAIIDPGVKIDEGYFVYDEGVRDGHFAKSPDGSIYEGAVWPGPAVFPDFTREQTRLWWGGKVKLLLDAGIRGIWNDMNEPANFTGPLPEDVRFSKGDHAQIHNVYGHLMAQATYEGMRRADNRRPFVLTRACCAGSQRYCSGWTGDNHSIWPHLQLSLTQMMNLGLSGMYMAGADVGGFGSDCTPELLIRWMQLGAISPFFRDHYAKGTRPQEAYSFDRDTMDACRKALDLRYHLLPYLYDLAHGDLPMLRPLVMEFPEDGLCRDISDECMLGEALLAAPVMAPGVRARAVYLPKGVWYDFYTGKRYAGGGYVLAEAPLDTIPLFARAGAVIPVSEGTPQSVEEIQRLTVKVFPGRGCFTHYTDDGETLDYQSGAIHALHIRVRGKTITQEVTADGFPGPDSLPVQWMA